MSQFYEKMKSSPGEGAFDKLTSKGAQFVAIKTPKETINLKASQALILHSNEQIVQYGANNINTTALSTGQSTDIKIDRSIDGHVHGITLEMMLRNNQATPVRFTPIPLLINYVEFLGNTGKITIGKYYGEHLFISPVMLSNEQWRQFGKVANSTPCWKTLAKLNGLETKIYQWKFHDNFLRQIRSHLRGLNGDITMRIFFNPYSKVNMAGQGDSTQAPDLVTCTLYLHLTEHTDEESAGIENLMKRDMVGASFFFLQPAYFRYSATFTANSPLTIPLNGVVGKIPFMFFMIRTTNPTGRQLIECERISSFELLAANSVNLLGGQPLNDKFIRNIQFPTMFPSDMMCWNGTYFITHASDVVTPFQGMGMPGYFEYDGTQQIKITPTVASVGVNEVQTVYWTGGLGVVAAAVTGGSFRFVFGGEETSEILFNDTSATMTEYLERLPSIGIGNVVVAGDFTAGAFTRTVTFQNDLGNEALHRHGKMLTMENNGDMNNGAATILFPRTIVSTIGSFKSGNTAEEENGWTSGAKDFEIWYYTYKLMTVRYGDITISSL